MRGRRRAQRLPDPGRRDESLLVERDADAWLRAAKHRRRHLLRRAEREVHRRAAATPRQRTGVAGPAVGGLPGRDAEHHAERDAVSVSAVSVVSTGATFAPPTPAARP